MAFSEQYRRKIEPALEKIDRAYGMVNMDSVQTSGSGSVIPRRAAIALGLVSLLNLGLAGVAINDYRKLRVTREQNAKMEEESSRRSFIGNLKKRMVMICKASDVQPTQRDVTIFECERVVDSPFYKPTNPSTVPNL